MIVEDLAQLVQDAQTRQGELQWPSAACPRVEQTEFQDPSIRTPPPQECWVGSTQDETHTDRGFAETHTDRGFAETHTDRGPTMAESYKDAISEAQKATPTTQSSPGAVAPMSATVLDKVLPKETPLPPSSGKQPRETAASRLGEAMNSAAEASRSMASKVSASAQAAAGALAAAVQPQTKEEEEENTAKAAEQEEAPLGMEKSYLQQAQVAEETEPLLPAGDTESSPPTRSKETLFPASVIAGAGIAGSAEVAGVMSTRGPGPEAVAGEPEVPRKVAGEEEEELPPTPMSSPASLSEAAEAAAARRREVQAGRVGSSPAKIAPLGPPEEPLVMPFAEAPVSDFFTSMSAARSLPCLLCAP